MIDSAAFALRIVVKAIFWIALGIAKAIFWIALGIAAICVLSYGIGLLLGGMWSIFLNGWFRGFDAWR